MPAAATLQGEWHYPGDCEAVASLPGKVAGCAALRDSGAAFPVKDRLLKCSGCVTGAHYPCATRALVCRVPGTITARNTGTAGQIVLHFWYKHMRMPCNVTVDA